MSGIVYFVGASEESARQELNERFGGQAALSRLTYAMPDKRRAHIVSRFNEMVALAGVTPMVKCADYEIGPVSKYEKERWLGSQFDPVGEKERFDRFVASGAGQWVEVAG